MGAEGLHITIRSLWKLLVLLKAVVFSKLNLAQILNIEFFWAWYFYCKCTETLTLYCVSNTFVRMVYFCFLLRTWVTTHAHTTRRQERTSPLKQTLKCRIQLADLSRWGRWAGDRVGRRSCHSAPEYTLQSSSKPKRGQQSQLYSTQWYLTDDILHAEIWP